MAPPSRRRILPSETLAAFGSAPLYPPSQGDGSPVVGSSKTVVPSAVMATLHHHGQSSSSHQSRSQSQTQQRRQQHSNPMTFMSSAPSLSRISKDDDPPPNGIKIGGWKITTQNSTIGDEKRMEELTVLLEDVANKGSAGKNKRRRLCPPEITFLDAIISFQKENAVTANTANDAVEMSSGEGDFTKTEFRFTARDALLEWAEAHQYLGMAMRQNYDCDDDVLAINPTTNTREDFRGVSILQTADAKIWSNKSTKNSVDDDDTHTTFTEGSQQQFYYDWTFSSPYAGTIILNQSSNQKQSNNDSILINHREQWHSLQQSHIPIPLLQDTSQPILFYDDIHLYEDDLHDNGDVSMNIKVRVMPKCWYVLQRLFVRVDHVCVKCHEARYFCLLDNDGISSVRDSQHPGNETLGVKVNRIYRDITWREATWEELVGLSLPTDPAAWREDGNVAVPGGNGAGAARGTSAPPALASLLTKLPVVTLPNDLPRFAYFDASKL